MVRLQKLIADAGVTSRRKAEDLIVSGRVIVNGKKVTELGAKADPFHDEVLVDGRRIEPRQPRIAVLLNKPDGYITSLRDPQGRPVVTKLVDDIPVRLYPVGRLDYHTEGLLILTNDGKLAQSVEHPSHAIQKVYLAKVKGIPSENQLERLRKGVVLEGRRTRSAKFRILETRKNSWLEITIREGRQNQIRKMFDLIGHSVLKLKRVAIGFLREGRLKPGQYRYLTKEEIMKFLKGEHEPSPERRHRKTMKSRRIRHNRRAK